MEIKRTKNNQNSPLKKSKMKSLILPSTKIYCKVIKTLNQCCIDITINSRIEQRTQKQTLEYININFDKSVTVKQWEKDALLNKLSQNNWTFIRKNKT